LLQLFRDQNIAPSQKFSSLSRAGYHDLVRWIKITIFRTPKSSVFQEFASQSPHTGYEQLLIT
jgi:hypothetical protein